MEKDTLEDGNLNISMKDLSMDQDCNGNPGNMSTMGNLLKIKSKALVFIKIETTVAIQDIGKKE